MGSGILGNGVRCEILEPDSDYAQHDERMNAFISEGKSSHEATFLNGNALSPTISADLG
jgi:hypothetical protein